MWIASLSKNGMLSPSMIGWVAFGESLVVSIGVVANAVWGQRVGLRRVAVTGAVLIVMGNAICILPRVATFLLGRSLGGLGAGFLACTTGIAARRPDALRVFSVQGIVMLLSSSGFELALPAFVEARGFVTLSICVASLAALAAVIMHYGFAGCILEDARPLADSGTTHRASMSAALAYVSQGIAGGAITPYTIVIGEQHGFRTQSLSYALSFAGAVAFLGPVIAHRLSDRIGIVRPVLISLGTIAITWLLFLNTVNPFLMSASLVVGSIAGSFFGPYGNALVNHVEPSRRLLLLLPALAIFGGAVGSKIGSVVLELTNIHFLGVVTTFFMILTMLFVAAAAWMPNEHGRSTAISASTKPPA